MSTEDSGSPKQFPNPEEEISIKEPVSISKERIELNHNSPSSPRKKSPLLLKIKK